ncbi:hypothetical protein B0E38_07548 [Streptomyces sp. 111WW2]|nr:hypothetical protein B0E38_07548 [Streptomyces sp. 111WW2]
MSVIARVTATLASGTSSPFLVGVAPEVSTVVTSAVISPAPLSKRTSVSVTSNRCAAEALTSLPLKPRSTAFVVWS